MFDPVTLFILATFGSIALLEVVRPARKLPRVRGWYLKGALFLVLSGFIATRAPALWEPWLAQHRLIDATGLGHVLGAIVGLLVLQLGVYAWHRALHKVDFLWKHLHQMHHSAERIDVWGAFYLHPLDVLGFGLVGSAVLALGIGLTLPAALFASFVTLFCNLFQHANLRTPRWLGYLVQRPESHALHHARGVHAHNYGDIPVWDLLFGTFRNPAGFAAENGFYPGASKRVGEMLIGRDVSEPPAEERRSELRRERTARVA